MWYGLLLLGGPVLGLIALIAVCIPRLRPQRLSLIIGILGLAASLPVAIAYAVNSGYPLLFLRAGTVVCGLIAAISYFVLSRRLPLPPSQSTAASALLVASVWDAVTLVIVLTPGFGGAYC